MSEGASEYGAISRVSQAQVRLERPPGGGGGGGGGVGGGGGGGGKASVA